MNALEILIAEIEHTAELAVEDGSKVTQSKLRAHLLQYAEAIASHKTPGQWTVDKVYTNEADEAVFVLSPSGSYEPDSWWPKVGDRLVKKDDR